MQARSIIKNEDGFTLVELIVVIVIIGILASITVPSLVGYIDRAKDNQLIMECRLTVVAAQSFASEEYAFGELKAGEAKADEAFISYVKGLSEVPKEASIKYINLYDASVSELAYVNGEKGVLYRNKEYIVMNPSEFPDPTAVFKELAGLSGEEKRAAIEVNGRAMAQVAEIAVKRMLEDLFAGQNIVGFSKGAGMVASVDSLVGGFSVYDAAGKETKNVNLNLGKYMIDAMKESGIANTDKIKTNFGYTKVTFTESNVKGVFTTTPKTIEFKGDLLTGDTQTFYVYDCVSGKIISPATTP